MRKTDRRKYIEIIIEHVTIRRVAMLFAFLFVIETGFLRRIGYSIGPVLPFSDPAPQVVAFQSLGALIVLSVMSLWTARSHLKTVSRVIHLSPTS